MNPVSVGSPIPEKNPVEGDFWKIRRGDRSVSWKVRLSLFLLLPLFFLFQWALSKSPFLVEEVYSQEIYPIFIQIQKLITGWFSFSLSEFFLYVLILLGTGCFFYSGFQFFKKVRSFRNIFIHGLLNILAIAGIVYSFFVLFWGFNHHRPSFSQLANWNVAPSKIEELISVSKSLILQANSLRELVEENELGVMKLKETPWKSL